MKQGIIVSLLLASSAYGGNVLDTFSSPSSWVNSGDSKYSGGEWDWSERGLSVAKKHKFYGISRVLEEPIVPGADGFVVQYEVTFQEGVSCSGSYLKLLESSPSFSPETLVESSPYSIMFGPDNCGSNNKVHVIFRQENPVTHVVEEKHLVSPPASITDSLPHLYTLQVFPDNSFVVKIDGEVKKKGSLLSDTDFSPSFNPPEEIEDPDDKKPEDWVDEAKIPDPSATKPDDWDEDAPRKIADPDATKPDDWQDDEPLEIPDPNAKEPEDWDEEDDGVWEAPMVKNPKCEAKNNCGEWKAPIIDNPAYKGKWSAPLIDNPDYKGAWKPRKIKNPGFFREENPIKTIKPIGAIAIEILANDKGITFSNVMIGNDIEESEEFVKVFLERQEEEKSKSKNKAKAASKEERERALEEGGLPGMIQYYFGEVSDFITDLGEDSPAAFYALVAVAVIVPVLAFLRGGKSESDATAAHKKDDDAAAEEEDDEKEEEDANDEDNEEDEEESEEEEDENTKKPRRRTPKAN